MVTARAAGVLKRSCRRDVTVAVVRSGLGFAFFHLFSGGFARE